MNLAQVVTRECFDRRQSEIRLELDNTAKRPRRSTEPAIDDAIKLRQAATPEILLWPIDTPY